MSFGKVIKSILLSISGIAIITISQLLANQISSLLNNKLEFIIFPISYIFLTIFIVWIVSKVLKQGNLNTLGISLEKVNIYWVFIGVILPIILNLLTILLNSGHFKVNPIENVPIIVFSAILGGQLRQG